MLLFLGVYVLGLSVQIVQLNLIRAFLDLAQTGARLKKTQPRHASAEIKKKSLTTLNHNAETILTRKLSKL